MIVRPLLLLALLVALAPGPAVQGQDSSPDGATEPPPESRWYSDLEAAVADAREHERYILVDLFADWCGWCHRLEKEVFSDPAFRRYASDFTLLRVDTEDGATGSWLQLRYGAESLPTTLVLDPDLVRVGKIQGFAPMPEFAGHIQDQVNGYLAILSFFDRLLEADDPELQRKVADDLLERGAGERAAQLYQRVLEQIRRGTDAEAWLTYQLADAYRIGKDFDSAREHLAQAHELAGRLDGESTTLVERLDLLKVHVAQESGDCDDTLASLRHFIDQHPASAHSTYAERTLDAIEKGEVMDQCT